MRVTNRSKSKLYENYIVFIFGLLLFKLTPISYLGAQWGNTIIEIFVFASLIAVLLINYKMKLNLDKISVILISLLLVFMFTELRVFFGYDSNFKEIFNMSLYSLIYITISSLFINYNLSRTRITKSVYKLLVLNIIISLIAFISPMIFEYFNVLFETTKSTTIGSSYKRFAGTFYNPNFFGIFFSIIACSFLYYAFQKKGVHIFLIVFSIICVYFVNISGSRSALITFVILLTVIAIKINYKVLFSKFKIFFILSLFICIPALIYRFLLKPNNTVEVNINSRFLNKDNILVNYQGRLDMVHNALELFNKSPIYGIGSSIESVDNQYAKVLMETGMIAMILLLILFIVVFYSQMKNFRMYQKFEEKIIILTSILFTVAYMLNMFGAAMFSVTQITSIYFLILSISNNHSLKTKILTNNDVEDVKA